jgi:hypothetical protein
MEQLAETDSGSRAITETEAAMARCGTTRFDWDKSGALFQREHKQLLLQKLHSLQEDIVKTVTERRVELDILHRRARGQKAAQIFLTQLKNRWSRLDRLVKTYNEELRYKGQQFEELQNLAFLDVARLKQDGIDYDEIWALDRLMCNEDWAIYDYVRVGIDSLFVLDRVAEEQRRIRAQMNRMLDWIQRTISGLESYLESNTQALCNQLILHRVRIIANLRHAVQNLHVEFVTNEDRQQLNDLYNRAAHFLSSTFGLDSTAGSTADNLENDAEEDEDSEDEYATESGDQHLGAVLSNEVDREESLDDMVRSEEGDDI